MGCFSSFQGTGFFPSERLENPLGLGQVMCGQRGGHFPCYGGRLYLTAAGQRPHRWGRQERWGALSLVSPNTLGRCLASLESWLPQL